jgi:urease accessory protein
MSNLLNLLHLSDPTLPIGGFSHSAGLETYVQLGIVKDVHSAKEFVVEMLTKNLQFNDAAFMSLAFDAIQNNDFDTFLALDNDCNAVKLPKEMRQASQKMGMRLLKNFEPLIANEFASNYLSQIKNKTAFGHYCLAFGLCASVFKVNKKDALIGFYYNAAVGFMTNSVKLIPLGQQDGQLLLYSLQPIINELAEKTLHPNKDLLGLCCAGFDIRSMQHEQLYSRLYMS